MKHIEASKRISTSESVDPSAVKYSLVQRLRGAFHVETVGEGVESFSVAAAGKSLRPTRSVTFPAPLNPVRN